MSDPHQVTRAFEAALCEFTGAKYAVTTTSCTMALTLALAWHWGEDGAQTLVLPANTYIGVPSAVKNAGHRVAFQDLRWMSSYGIKAIGGKVRDCAWWLERRMYQQGEMQGLSFHWTKPLGIGQGGCILHDNPRADAWLRRARFDGRTEGVDPADDEILYPNWHAYMSPETAATGLIRLQAGAFRTDHVARFSDYPDISQQRAFK
jgi:dTDP-4-amino-4,6-dideoxygalactose transaminase